ncbi:hypothetical protein WJX79_001705 [Trebouxia sp. C0005]
MSRPVDQPSAAKPRDLRQDLAIAAQQTTKKRKVDGGENQEKQALGTADATQHPAVANAGHRRHSTVLSARPPLGTVTAGRPEDAKTQAEEQAHLSIDDSILLQNLRDELAAQCADVAEARRLKYHVRNTEVLQEQLHAAQLRAEAAEKQVTQAEQLSLQLAELQSRQEVWDKVLQGLSGAETPENVLILLESLQTQILKSTELLGQKENQLAKQAGLLKTLQKVYEDQSKELALLQERLGKGEFDRSKTRVIHFKHNPEAEAVEKAQQSKCSTLQAENTALKGQLQKLEGHSAAAAAGSIDVAVQEAQITVLQHKVADLEKAKTRLSQNRLSKEVETFIDRFNSIAAFTANYTMEQFQKQTQC